MAADMICAYYDREADIRALFEKRSVAGCEGVQIGENEIQWDVYLGRFNVVRLVMTDFIKAGKRVSEALKSVRDRILNDLHEVYPDINYDSSDLVYSMDKFYRATGT